MNNQVYKAKKQSRIPIVLYVLILFSSVMLVLVNLPDGSSFGQNDFREYWSAFRLMLSGRNPYDPLIMKEFQYEFLGKESPLMMWNPPWLLLIMAPFLCFSFASASMIWVGWSMLLFMISSLISIKVIERGLSLPLTNTAIIGVLLSSLLFPPFYNGMYLGQISSLLLLGVSLFFLGISQGRIVWLVVGSMLLSVKPHMFVYAGMVVFWWMIFTHKWKDLFVLFVSMLAMLFLTECLFPNSIAWWVSSFSDTISDVVPHPYQWIGPTLGGALRYYVSEVFFELNFLIVLFTGLFTVVMLQKKIGSVHINWSFWFPVLIAISVYISPFGWFFDQIVLVPLYVMLNLVCIVQKKWILFSFLIAFQLSSHVYVLTWGAFHVEMFWFVPGILLFWILVFQKSHLLSKVK